MSNKSEIQSHDGDCHIYSGTINGRPYDGICTCGYGLSRLIHVGRPVLGSLVSVERTEFERRREFRAALLPWLVWLCVITAVVALSVGHWLGRTQATAINQRSGESVIYMTNLTITNCVWFTNAYREEAYYGSITNMDMCQILNVIGRGFEDEQCFIGTNEYRWDEKENKWKEVAK